MAPKTNYLAAHSLGSPPWNVKCGGRQEGKTEQWGVITWVGLRPISFGPGLNIFHSGKRFRKWSGQLRGKVVSTNEEGGDVSSSGCEREPLKKTGAWKLQRASSRLSMPKIESTTETSLKTMPELLENASTRSCFNVAT